MPLLVDCYNVLHAEKPPALAGLTTARLCRTLARSAWTGDRIVVVCDGRPLPLELTESPVDAVELVYSGVQRPADAVIIERIDADTAPRRLIVVSSDHEIQQAARRRRARPQSSEQFLHALAQQLDEPRPPAAGADKPEPDDISNAEVEVWLQRFGYEDAATTPAERPPQPSDLRPEEDPDAPWPPPDVEPKNS